MQVPSLMFFLKNRTKFLGEACCGRWLLSQSDLNVRGVTGFSQILGMVTLPMHIVNGAPAIQMDFYVANKFPLLTNELFGLLAMKSNRIEIKPNIAHSTITGSGSKQWINQCL